MNIYEINAILERLRDSVLSNFALELDYIHVVTL